MSSMEWVPHSVAGSKLSLASNEVDSKNEPFHRGPRKNIRERDKSQIVTSF